VLTITIIINAIKHGTEITMIAHDGMYLPFLHGCRRNIRIANPKQIKESIKGKDVISMVSSRFYDAAAVARI